MPRFLATILLFCCGAVASHADVLVLANNDRLTGTTIREESGMIVFQSDMLGEITVASDKARIERPQPKVAEVKKPRRPDANYKFKPLDLRTAARDPSQAAKAEQTSWVRRLEFGYSAQSGRAEKSDLSFAFEAGRRSTRSEARFHARYLYGESSGRQTSDLAESTLRLRRSLSPRTFAQSSTRVSRDVIKRLDLDGEQGFGLGRNVISSKSIVLAMGAGAAARYRDETTNAAEWDYLVDGFQDFRYELNSRLSIVQDLSLVVAPANDNDYKFRLNAALTGKVTDAFNMSMRYEYEYDRSLAIHLRDNQRIVTALVYVF